MVLIDRRKMKGHVLEECFVLVFGLMPRFDSLWILYTVAQRTEPGNYLELRLRLLEDRTYGCSSRGLLRDQAQPHVTCSGSWPYAVITSQHRRGDGLTDVRRDSIGRRCQSYADEQRYFEYKKVRYTRRRRIAGTRWW